MQVPSMNVRTLADGEEPHWDEVAITDEQATRIAGIKGELARLTREHNELIQSQRDADLASRAGLSRGAKKRANKERTK